MSGVPLAVTEGMSRFGRPCEEVAALFPGVRLARLHRSADSDNVVVFDCAGGGLVGGARHVDPRLSLLAAVKRGEPTLLADPESDVEADRFDFADRWMRYMDSYDVGLGTVWVLAHPETDSSGPVYVDRRVVDWRTNIAFGTTIDEDVVSDLLFAFEGYEGNDVAEIAERNDLAEIAERNDLAEIAERSDDVAIAERTHDEEELFRSLAFQAFTELRHELKLSANEAADLVGVGRTTPNAWERDGHEPQARTARRLYQLSGLVGAVFRALGEMEADAWLMRGSPTPIELMQRDDLGEFANAVETVIMAGPSRPLGSEVAEPEGATPIPPGGTKRRISTRRRQ